MSQTQQLLAAMNNNNNDRTRLPTHVVNTIMEESRRYEKELERVKREHEQRLIIIQDLALTATQSELLDALMPCENKKQPTTIF